MVCINGCCGIVFCLWPILCHHPSTPHQLTSSTYIHLQPSSLGSSYEHNFEGRKNLLHPVSTNFAPAWAQFCPKKAIFFKPTLSHFPSRLRCCGSMSKFCTSFDQKNTRWAQILHQLGESFWQKKPCTSYEHHFEKETPDEHKFCIS